MILQNFAMNCFAVQLQGLIRPTFRQPLHRCCAARRWRQANNSRRSTPFHQRHRHRAEEPRHPLFEQDRKALGPCAQVAGVKRDGSVIRRRDGILSSCGSKGGIVVTRGDIQKRFASPQILSPAKFFVHDLRGRFDHGTAARCPQIPLSGDQGWTARDGDGVRDGVFWAWQ